jgi:hypothetical protein
MPSRIARKLACEFPLEVMSRPVARTSNLVCIFPQIYPETAVIDIATSLDLDNTLAPIGIDFESHQDIPIM